MVTLRKFEKNMAKKFKKDNATLIREIATKKIHILSEGQLEKLIGEMVRAADDRCIKVRKLNEYEINDLVAEAIHKEWWFKKYAKGVA